jgi:hypothetical protein
MEAKRQPSAAAGSGRAADAGGSQLKAGVRLSPGRNGVLSYWPFVNAALKPAMQRLPLLQDAGSPVRRDAV